MKRVFLWELLVSRGLFNNQKTAKSWIMAGKVIVDDQRIDKAGYLVSENASIRVKGVKKYVGKGGLKLEGALADFGTNVSGKIALDVGASIGGFTDCLLQYGAIKVYSVDVGYGLFAGKLRIDKRVVNLEKTNISEILPNQLQPTPSLATVDLSYLSLKTAIPIISCLLTRNGEMICLVKPLFEVSDSSARRTGQIKNTAVYCEILHKLVTHVDGLGLKTVGITHSHVTGSKGTREFFLRISKDKMTPSEDIGLDIQVAITAGMKVPVYGRPHKS